MADMASCISGTAGCKVPAFTTTVTAPTHLCTAVAASLPQAHAGTHCLPIVEQPRGSTLRQATSDQQAL